MIEIVHTRHSVYEIDPDNNKIRRIEGDNPPTPRQGEDGVWQEAHVQRLVFGGLLITWADGRQTVTSAVARTSTRYDNDTCDNGGGRNSGPDNCADLGIA